MILFPEVKKFIELYIKDIEEEDTKYLFQESQAYFNDAEFNQFYSILDSLEYRYDLDQFIDEIISENCEEIIHVKDGEYICIEDEWKKYSSHYFGNKDKIIEQFDDFEDWYIKNGKHYCKVYDDWG